MKQIILSITGKIPSKKNRYEIGNGRFFQNREVSDWMNSTAWDLRTQYQNKKNYFPIKEQVKLIIDIWSDSRADLDNQIVTVCDLLQMGGVIVNDKLVKHIIANKIISREPRAKILIEYSGDNLELRKNKKETKITDKGAKYL